MQVGGANGSGKTSLLRMLCGLAIPAHGEIRWGGSEIRSLGGAYYADMTYLGHLSGVKDDPDRTGEPAHFQRARRDRSRC